MKRSNTTRMACSWIVGVALRVLSVMAFVNPQMAVAKGTTGSWRVDSARVAMLSALPASGIGLPAFSIVDAPTVATTESGAHRRAAAMGAQARAVFATPVYVDPTGLSRFPTPSILVRFDGSLSREAQVEALEAVAGLTVLDEEFGGMARCYRLRSTAATGEEALAQVAQLRNLPGVDWAEADWISEVRSHSVTPNDPHFPEQWGIRNTGQILPGPGQRDPLPGVPDRDVNADHVWSFTIGDPSVVVVVLDDGVQQGHLDIHQIPGADFTGSPALVGGPGNECDNHGTQMAGAISGVIDNGIGVAGVAPGCRIASARIVAKNVPCNGTGFLSFSAMVAALDWAQSIGARVTTNSNAFGFSQAVSDKYAETRAAGMVHFAATGNEGASTISYPASDASVLAIAAIRHNGTLYPPSNTGEGMFAVAPGTTIWTTDRTGTAGGDMGDYLTVNGTSPAGAFAAGVAALLLSVDGTLSPDQVESTLAATARFNADGYSTTIGYGTLDARGAVEAVGDVFVSGEAASGGDGTLEAPFQTVGQGVGTAASGEVVIVKAGSYGELLTLSQPVTLKAASGAVVLGP